MRLPRFRLRTLMVAVAVVALGFSPGCGRRSPSPSTDWPILAPGVEAVIKPAIQGVETVLITGIDDPRFDSLPSGTGPSVWRPGDAHFRRTEGRTDRLSRGVRRTTRLVAGLVRLRGRRDAGRSRDRLLDAGHRRCGHLPTDAGAAPARRPPGRLV